jgi:uncharacterized protein YceK
MTGTLVRLTVLALTVALSGCGLAETAATAATQGAAAAEQAKQGQELEAKVKKDLDAAQQGAKQQLDAAEAASNPSN